MEAEGVALEEGKLKLALDGWFEQGIEEHCKQIHLVKAQEIELNDREDVRQAS